MNSLLPTNVMRRTIAPLFYFVLTVCILPNLAAAQTNSIVANREMQSWKTLASVDSKFSISLPSTAEEVSIPIETGEKTFKMRVFMAKTTAAVYVINHVSFPDALKFKEAIEEGFNAGLDYFLEKNKDIVLKSERKVMLGRHAGREMIYESSTTSIKLQTFIAREGIYTLELTTPILFNAPEDLVKVYQAESNKFFNSFQILDNKKPENLKRKKH